MNRNPNSMFGYFECVKAVKLRRQWIIIQINVKMRTLNIPDVKQGGGS